MKKWLNPSITVLSVENTREGIEEYKQPDGCYCNETGNQHNHGAPGQGINQDCQCCNGMPDIAFS